MKSFAIQMKWKKPHTPFKLKSEKSGKSGGKNDESSALKTNKPL